MIQVAYSLPDDVGATLTDRARGEGFDNLSDYLRSLAEMEAGHKTAWHVTPEVEAALEEAERSGYVAYDFDAIIAHAKAEVRSR